MTYSHHMAILRKLAIALLVFAVIIGGFLFYLTRGDEAGLTVEAVTGVEPTLEEPDPESFPTVQIAKPVGWEEGQAPIPGEGLAVNRFAEGLDHPRVLYALPNGDVLVTLTRAPAAEGPVRAAGADGGRRRRYEQKEVAP